jgi:hypothetical protein
MAGKKSVSRKSAARKVVRKAAKKTAKKAAKKAAKTPRRRVAAKKVVTTRKKAAARPKAVATVSPAVMEIDRRIAIVRANLRELVEQAASYSGASDDERMSQRIAEQETRLATLIRQREEFSSDGR